MCFKQCPARGKTPSTLAILLLIRKNINLHPAERSDPLREDEITHTACVFTILDLKSLCHVTVICK